MNHKLQMVEETKRIKRKKRSRSQIQFHVLILNQSTIKEVNQTINKNSDRCSNNTTAMLPKVLAKQEKIANRIIKKKLAHRVLPKKHQVSLFKMNSEENVKVIEFSAQEKLDLNEKLYFDHLRATFFALKQILSLPQPPSSLLQEKKLNLEYKPGTSERKTIIFDLDETLVHCVGANKGEISLLIDFPSGKSSMAGINIRPFALECLKEANKLFEVIVFTASHKCYADVILDYLDPNRTIFHHRLYRENCVQVSNDNIKDLRILNRNPENIVIVDNSVYSFAYHLDNGVPIVSWFDNPCDTELLNLIEYFRIIADTHDVRDVNRQIFHLDSFYEDFVQEFSNC